MAVTANPSFATGGISQSQFTSPIIFNDLNSQDRSYLKKLVAKFGDESSYNLFMMAEGKFMDTDMTDNHSFYHYEKRQMHQSFAVLADVAAVAGNATATVTLGAGDYYEGGARSSVRAGSTYMLASSNILVQAISINTGTPNAHTVTFKSLDGSVIASAGTAGATIKATDLFLDRGATNVGEGSTLLNGIAPVWDRVTNTVTEHRDDFTITDIADMEKQEVFLIDGKPYIFDIAVDDLNKRYLNDQFWKLMEGVTVTNTGLTAATGGGITNGTKGVIPYANANGSTIQYTAGAVTIADWQALARQVIYYGNSSEYHMLMDQLSKQTMDTFLNTTYKGSFNQASYESVGGSKESGGAYGFDTFRINGITWHLFMNPQFTTSKIYKRPTPYGAKYDNYTLDRKTHV